MPELIRPNPGDDVAADWGEDVTDRVVSRYASEGTRDAAGPHQQGMVCYVIVSDKFQTFDGSAWNDISTNAELTAVINSSVQKSGDTMSGNLNLPNQLFEGAEVGSFSLNASLGTWKNVGTQVSLPSNGKYLISVRGHSETAIGTTNLRYELRAVTNDDVTVYLETVQHHYGSAFSAPWHNMQFGGIIDFADAGQSLKVAARREVATAGTCLLRKCKIDAIRLAD